MPQHDLSLSIVLPVHNIQNLLPMLVCELMEMVSDFVTHFELIVVDDGSTDQTDEVASDLALQYPQVRAVRHASRLGGEAVIRTGSEMALGRVVIVQRENDCLRAADLLRLGQLSRQCGVVVDRPKHSVDAVDFPESIPPSKANSRETLAPHRPKFLSRGPVRRDARDGRETR